MLLESFLPLLPTSVAETWIFVGAGLSIILLVYAVFIEKEHRQDLVRLVGTGGLLIYALYIQNLVFTIAMGALAVASLVEFIEIMMGIHKHSPEDLQRYKTFVRTKHLEKNKNTN
ncbi:MAG: hypothetical protein UV82_C0003G0083 [Candidatus Magasanikbacteria bacterium GW2011_GWD2_43_18]|uniref:Uncharacterized protein n=1 Tax=Candidatus Magasanikbacteria bacterium GW2011_GWE2_42_7 TaxID=1619052 RepID=A0A0G1BH12_9BACT|nr:MAG: hypothetical protein UV18_C0006G0066 [Candidatus Magasanikbacteria bacterium GW2011_GWC2_42_27]KKS72695.1 MAG: hypothetical protein UV42_C0005G0012 [Candidatus Magasanikbacteria bacterium GW2011_GWE2_42_7]KKT04983.1 MAG: hypothetical protein UV82_C0003G0083 [Candidatus Magasanikbacteria bacterium GW2011_GWD2_43_18]KKT25105.1 MAG: hypothetical protein UW10_C0014G0016 [Candidatus Magasanikbacteria bacterium GW2011_GWA2_43_9]HBB38294.1 hypothetical protein [Candidatus Magasanikbacteria bac